MGELRHRDESRQNNGSVPSSSGFIDFILARAKAQDLSTRQIAVMSGLRRGRCHAILHRDYTKRLPFRIDEINVILAVLKIDRLEATLANEMLGDNPTLDEQSVHRIVLLVSEFVRGLPAQILDIVEHIEGLEFDDLRKEHGKWLQTAVCEIIKDQYIDVVRRREFRLASLKA